MFGDPDLVVADATFKLVGGFGQFVAQILGQRRVPHRGSSRFAEEFDHLLLGGVERGRRDHLPILPRLSLRTRR